jgi:hypothetical protein
MGATTYRFWRRSHETDWQQIGDLSEALIVKPTPNGVPYRWAVQTLNASGTGSNWVGTSWGAPLPDRAPIVSGLTVQPGNGAYTVGWDPIDGVSQYNVYTSPTLGSPYAYRVTTNDPFDTHVTITGDPNGMVRYVTAFGYSNNLNGDYPPEVPVTPSGSALTTPAPVPTAGNEAMELQWPPVTGATSYRIYRRAPGTDWKQLVSVTIPLWTDYSVEDGEHFRYAVQAVSASSASAWGMLGMALVDPNLPHAPAPVTLQPGNGGVQVFWPVVPEATSYNVFYANTQAGPYSYAGSTPSTYETRFPIYTGNNGNPMWVVVVSYTGSNGGTSSDPVSAVPLATLPTQASVSLTAGSSAGTIHIAWFGNTGATNYRLYRRTAMSAVSLVSGTNSGSSYDDVGLVSGTTYTYYVEPENAAGRGLWSSAQSVAAP